MTQPWGGPGGGVVTVGYQYDAQDHLTRVTDGEGGVTQYAYSDRDLLTQEISEVSGTTTHRYNEHGQLDRTTDARGVVASRTLDALDRLTAVGYPDVERNVTYVYDDPAVPHSLGRLTRIERGRTRVDHAYDGYGRMTGDGALAYGLDANGNRSTLTYPGGVIATSAFDFADRPTGVSVSWPEGGSTQMATVASGAQYAAAGPLRRLVLGNGLIEQRSHDQRYFPDRITVLIGADPVLDWDYAVDAVGNPTRIDEATGPGSLHQVVVPRIYGYQDLQYYLTQGDGPWGTLDWAYDRIGNRLSEQRDGGAVEAYDYRANGAGGNTATLETVNVNRTYSFGPAGHLEQVNAAGNVITFDHDDEGRLGGIARQLGEAVTADYDGRGFLAEIGGLGSGGLFGDRFESGDASCWNTAVSGPLGNGPCGPPRIERTEATYTSDGVLHHLHQVGLGLWRDRYVVMFSGRPVAVLTIDAGTGELQYLSADHLGTPMLATSETGAVEWQGGFEPFGRDWLEGTASAALASGVFLRFPGQWVDAVWSDPANGASVSYNLQRWYNTSSARYITPDPLGDLNPFSYVGSSPTSFFDPFGLCRVDVQFNQIGVTPFGRPYFHAYVVVTDSDGSRTQYRAGPSRGGAGSGRAITSGGAGSASRSCCASGSSNSGNSTSPGTGPGGNDRSAGPFGSLVGTIEPFTPAAIDWPAAGLPHARNTLFDNDQPCGCLPFCLEMNLNQMAAARVPYNPFSTNSNAAAFEILRKCGLSPPSRAPAFSPGWGVRLTP